jgi:hypothetical protein
MTGDYTHASTEEMERAMELVAGYKRAQSFNREKNLGKISAKFFEARRGHAAVNGRPDLKSLSQKVICISSNQALRGTVQHFTSLFLASN